MRPSTDATLMKIASAWEERSTCSRNHVGAVIAKDGRTLGSGYNGAPAGMPHCEHIPVEERVYPRILERAAIESPRGGCRIAIHAESNAIAYCARHGVSIEGATIYTTLSPCYSCAQLIIAAGLTRVVYGRQYRDKAGLELLIAASLTVEWWTD